MVDINKKYIIREFFKLCDGGICQDLLSESEKLDVRNNGALYLSGIAQLADQANGNGRIYPYNILHREVEKYKQLVAEDRAVGECVKGDTGILTEKGWKEIKDVQVNENIFTLNLLTNKLEIQPVLFKTNKPFSGKMIRFYNGHSLDMTITPDHKVVLFDRNNKPYTLLGNEVYNLLKENNNKLAKSYIRRSGEWNSEKMNIIHQHTTKGIYMDIRFIKTELINVDENVYCVTVPNGTWIMKNMKSSIITGNCDHPEDVIINLKNVSHKIVSIWMEGKQVMVKMKVLSTPSGQILRALVNDNVAIGLSSRGLGSVRERSDGKIMVEDDFGLLCFDVVQEPSVRSAFMHLSEAKYSLPPTSKSERINKALLECLRKPQ